MLVNYVLDDLKEEETFHQKIKGIDLRNHESLPTTIVQDDALNKHVFH
jgi:hypothetical protein